MLQSFLASVAEQVCLSLTKLQTQHVQIRGGQGVQTTPENSQNYRSRFS